MTTGNRRDFMKRAVLTGTAVLGATGGEPHAAAEQKQDAKPVDRRRLGRIDATASILGLGLGSAFTRPFCTDPDAGRALVRLALSRGVTYWDTARDYGPSEEIIGPLVKEVRKQVFLVSKTAWRDYDGFMRELETSLKNLQTDRLDLYHIHNLRPNKDKDLDKIERGAIRAARKAKDEGMIGAFGVTGHSGAEVLIKAIRQWNPDAVLTTFPCTRPDKGRFEDDLLPLARERKMAVIAMKTVRHAREADLKGSDLVRYALSLDGVCTAVVGLDTREHLEANVAMATAFKPMGDDERAELHTRAVAAIGDLPAPWDMPGYEDAFLV